MNIRIKQRTVLGGRLAMLRENYQYLTIDDDGKQYMTYGLKQGELAKKLEDLMGGECHLTTPMISAWETGRKGVPEKYIPALCDIFNVTEEYLLGYTSNPTSTDSETGKNEDDRYEISAANLPDYDGEPIWCCFTTYEYEDAWAIYNGTTHQLIFKDGERFFRRPRDIKYFTKIPDYEEKSAKAKRSLDINQIIRCKKVYVIMNSPDGIIRAKFNGWYNVDTEHNVLVNPWNSLTLSLEGCNVSFRAYSTGNSSSKIIHERAYEE